jgi:hypothetical protein
MSLHPQTSWHQLVGSRVEVRRGGDVLDVGIVDDAMADGTLLWLAQEGAKNRRIIELAVGDGIWASSRNQELVHSS